MSRGLRAFGFQESNQGIEAPSKRQGHEVFRWLPLVYFSVMETLQGISYFYIGECGETANRTLTYLSYIHIAFQPFFVNMFAMSWLEKKRRVAISKWIWWACGLTTFIFILMLLPIPKFGNCEPSLQTMCGEIACSYRGDWHIAWILPLNGLDSFYVSYAVICFVVPWFYGSRRFVIYHFLLGPLPVHWLTTDKNERPAIWCLLSIAFLCATHIPFIERHLTMREKQNEVAHN